MANRAGESRTARNTTKQVRARLDDYLYLHNLAGDDPIRVAVRECVQAHKELKGAENVEFDWED